MLLRRPPVHRNEKKEAAGAVFLSRNRRIRQLCNAARRWPMTVPTRSPVQAGRRTKGREAAKSRRKLFRSPENGTRNPPVCSSRLLRQGEKEPMRFARRCTKATRRRSEEGRKNSPAQFTVNSPRNSAGSAVIGSYATGKELLPLIAGDGVEWQLDDQ